MTKIFQPQLDVVSDKLKRLPPAPEAERALTTRQAISKLRPQITAALKRGYTHEQVALMLRESGLTISSSTLRRYLQPAMPVGKPASVRPRAGQSEHAPE